jgi:lipopolysaccharide/colanic/teichoic acid biosynthesis glycosyltransferase
MEQKAAPYPFLKCLTDKLISFFLLAVFVPIIILVVLAMAISMLVRPSDRGRFLYRERRVSRGREFDVLKFRVLREDVIAQMPPEDKHAFLFEKDASNLTWAGRCFLKRCYLDELPQLFNILKGDMSLVGPRPWPVSMVHAQLKRGVAYRKLIRAGWTGPAQLQKDHPAPRPAEELDLEYFNQCHTWPGWRLWLYDVTLLGRSIRLMVQGKGLSY